MQVDELKETGKQIRKDIVKMVNVAGSGHPAGAMGLADIFAVLFFSGLMRIDPRNPSLEDRDRFILSNGHTCPGLYSAMARRGFFPVDKLWTLRELGSPLQGHPHRTALPGLETSSGPLGSGLSQAAGMALVGKRENKEYKVFCVGSDGEHEEGNWWEAMMFAAKYKLSNLIVIVDRNNIQIDGFTKDVMPLGSLKEKYKAFNWNVQEIDGHNYFEIMHSIEVAKESSDKPNVIIANTIPGKGVSFMENKPEWHGKPLSNEQLEKALEELEQDG